ncbi:hypothetical protein [Taylorella equigenitalis]|uniref:Uncharacterized protein n=2 Tax=Taylorella equigenitalis TaxID=29575 RepID=A0A654KF85_TAYEM|nr:hypothetical protein [Taylorella equigenitalis]ADU91084.1 hypothetical protein TEQUI_0128 [Taylorella equigenitalis MCE9]AFN36188.1 hypothetical protein KUI_1123 [Taylorella equigenitalis ATCC 35865]ASY39593.1 hypothetical protein CA604_05635 [Taylorella equigenitalis]WDU48952.1 hypothetical protein KNO34_05515 [Taylorella equigenitalis]WDU51426.1 hypothetical protein KNO32_05495 [Taylorella equigenitalis]
MKVQKKLSSEAFELLTTYGRTIDLLISNDLIEELKETAIELREARFTKNLAFLHKIEGKYIASCFLKDDGYFQVFSISKEKPNLDEELKNYLSLYTTHPFYWFNDFKYDSFEFLNLVGPDYEDKVIICSYDEHNVEMLVKKEQEIYFDPQLALSNDEFAMPIYFNTAKEAKDFIKNRYFDDVGNKKYYLVNGKHTFRNQRIEQLSNQKILKKACEEREEENPNPNQSEGRSQSV